MLAVWSTTPETAAVQERWLAEVRAAAAEVVTLATCERHETYCLQPWGGRVSPAAWHQSPVGFRLRTGDDAVRHLFRVASGLESRLVGEAEITGQVRRALAQARTDGSARHRIGRYFGAALGASRHIRQRAGFDLQPVSYAELGADRILEAVGRHEALPIAVVGTGELARQLVSSLKRRGLTHLLLVGRHPERTRTLAAEVGASWRLLPDDSTAVSCAAAILAARSASFQINADTLHRWNTGLFLDLGGIPFVAADLETAGGIVVVRLRDLGSCTTHETSLSRAHESLDHALARFRSSRGRMPEQPRFREVAA